jgi:hypothetical protein
MCHDDVLKYKIIKSLYSRMWILEKVQTLQSEKFNIQLRNSPILSMLGDRISKISHPTSIQTSLNKNIKIIFFIFAYLCDEHLMGTCMEK